MAKVFLEGSLGRRFGREWELDVKSPTEALRAINANTKGAVREYLSGEGAKKFYKVAIDKKKNFLTKDEVGAKTGSRDIYIIPTINGSGDNSGVIMAIVGIALIWLTWGTGSSIVAGWGASPNAVTAIQMVGFSMLLGGAMQLLTPTPKIGENSSDQQTSDLFQGNATAISQGNPVPLVYGRALVAPMPISFNITTVDKPGPSPEEELPQRKRTTWAGVDFGNGNPKKGNS